MSGVGWGEWLGWDMVGFDQIIMVEIQMMRYILYTYV